MTERKKSFKEALRKWDAEGIEVSDILYGRDMPKPAERMSPEAHKVCLPDPKTAQKTSAGFVKAERVLASVLTIFLTAALLFMVAALPRFGDADVPAVNEVYDKYVEDGVSDTGAVNLVAGMILDYRAFDTLGESFVLFTALTAVMLLLGGEKEQTGMKRFDLTRDVVLGVTLKVLLPVVFMFGVYVVLCGHLSPGGGFSGGTIIGAALILYSLAYSEEAVTCVMNTRRFKTLTVAALTFYCVGKGYSFTMGANGLSTGIPLGTPGNIVSAGLILPLNIAVGITVACTMYGLWSLFRKGEI